LLCVAAENEGQQAGAEPRLWTSALPEGSREGQADVLDTAQTTTEPQAVTLLINFHLIDKLSPYSGPVSSKAFILMHDLCPSWGSEPGGAVRNQKCPETFVNSVTVPIAAIVLN
jgi:hypothetical protein